MTRSKAVRYLAGSLRVAIAIAAAMCVLWSIAPPAYAQTFQVIHFFTGPDGTDPAAGLTMDSAGNLYGTADSGGQYGNGTVFKLRLYDATWIFMPLYSFHGASDGGGPMAPLAFGPSGALYGTTANYASVFNLRPSANRPAQFMPWVLTSLYLTQQFLPGGNLAFDQAGNIYGASIAGGNPACYAGCGFIYELSPSGNSWTETAIYSFTDMSDGAEPVSVTIDHAGNLYAPTFAGGINNQGTIFELTPSGSGWSSQTIYSFNGNSGVQPQAGLIADAAGNFYGTTAWVTNGSGTVFELSPSGNGWTYTVLYTLPQEYREERYLL